MVLNSSCIRDIFYCAAGLNLTVSMDSGVYTYVGVPLEVAALFLVSESKGSFYNRFIKNEYQYHRLQ